MKITLNDVLDALEAVAVLEQPDIDGAHEEALLEVRSVLQGVAREKSKSLSRLEHTGLEHIPARFRAEAGGA